MAKEKQVTQGLFDSTCENKKEMESDKEQKGMKTVTFLSCLIQSKN